jgi:hypothetical protein
MSIDRRSTLFAAILAESIGVTWPDSVDPLKTPHPAAAPISIRKCRLVMLESR